MLKIGLLIELGEKNTKIYRSKSNNDTCKNRRIGIDYRIQGMLSLTLYTLSTHTV